MAVVHGKNLKHKLAAVAVQGETKQVTVNLDNDVAEVTAAGDTAKEYLEGVYGWTAEGEYNWDGASGYSDHTIFRLFTSGEQNLQVVPAGGTVSTDNPIFRGNTIVKSYQITVPIGGAVVCRATYQGTGVLNRYTSGDY